MKYKNINNKFINYGLKNNLKYLFYNIIYN